MAQLLQGAEIAKEIKEETKEKMRILQQQGKAVTLAFIQVGADTASSVYMRSQQKVCEYIGITSKEYIMSVETTEAELISLLEELNQDSSVNGILVETPLPHQINQKHILNKISPQKDVDGFHPQNIGALALGETGFLPCTPSGIVQLLKRSGIVIAGTNCVIVGRSHNVGIPMALLMLRENATVTITHSKTQNLPEICKTADILIVALGKKEMITSEYIKEDAVVVDVGMHRNEDGSLCGDVDFKSVEKKVLAITPVPGGVGPMTIAMLTSSCVDAYLKSNCEVGD